MVAEKHRVCRFAGSTDKIRRMAGRNPMSSMRSASSSTRMLTWRRSANLRFIRSCKRPGVAITSSEPARRLLNLGLLGYSSDDERGFRHFADAQLFVLFVNLHCELTGWKQDQSGGVARRLALKHFDQRDEKCEGLASAGLGGADDVSPFESGRNRVFLDGG